MSNVAELIGLFLAGLGLFFIGIRLIGANLRKMAGRKFRLFIAQITKIGWLNSIIGIFAGAITQSTAAVTFIMTGMVSAGLISTRKAYPIILWSNLGNCVLVFLAVINFHLMILYLIGLVGCLYYFDFQKSKRLKPILGTFLAVTLLFLGLDFIKFGASSIKEFEWLSETIALAQESYLLGLALAVLISFFIQSAATLSAITIALAKTGVLTMDSSLIIIYGTNLGPALATWFVTSNLKGPARRLSFFQIIFRAGTLALFVSIFYVELYSGLPLFKSFLKMLTPDLALELALAYFMFQFVGCAFLTVFINPVDRYLERKFPITHEERLSQPAYITEESLREPEMAILLLERDQQRLFERIISYFDGVRADSFSDMAPDTLHSATVSLSHELDEFARALIKCSMSDSLLEQSLNLQNRMEIYIGLEEALYEIIAALPNYNLSPSLETFKHSVIEGTHNLMLMALDTLQDPTSMNLSLLHKLTEDRGNLLKKIHSEIRAINPLTLEERQIFDTLSSRFEYIVWMTRYLNKLVASNV